MNNKTFNYYEAPPQEVFDDIKENSIKIWKTYDDTYGYQSEKVNRIKDLQNIKDNAYFMVAMFDPINQMKLISMVKLITKNYILGALNS